MTKRERVLAAVQGKPVDHVPSGFWLHFPEAQFYGDDAVEAHTKFFKETQSDILKIMNENVIPCDVPIKSAKDWGEISSFNRNSKFITDQIEITKRILDRSKQDGVILLTIHGLIASAWHARGGTAGYETNSAFLTTHLREDPKAVFNGYEKIAEALIILTEEAFKAGVDGIYYAALGGETYLYNEEEFAQYVKPLELQILKAAQKRPKFNVLHICKDQVNLNRYLEYPAEVINWSTHHGNPSLEDGRLLFPDKVILGGLEDRAGVLIDGTDEELETEVHRVLDRMGTKNFILGADCTLPTDIPYDKIHAAVKATATYQNK